MEFPSYFGFRKHVIIAMKGLPNTGKSEIAGLIGRWASCPVLYIDDFLSMLSLEKGYSSEVMPSEEEAQRLHRLAFDALCNSALRYMHYFTEYLVIKSRLCTTFELDRLLQLSKEASRSDDDSIIIIIIECHIKNEHRLYNRLESIANKFPQHKKEWYKARSRLDFEKARDDWLNNSQPRTWDCHLSNLINRDEKWPTRVTRLILDPFYDLNLVRYGRFDLTLAFREVISYLITRKTYGVAEEGDWIGEEIIRDRYEVVQFGKLRRYLVEKELRMASIKKNKYLCPTSRGGKCCVFKTYMKEEEEEDDEHSCGVCEERVVSKGYTCHFCFLTLHKSCAERPSINFPHLSRNIWMHFYPFDCESYLPMTYACKSCTEGGKRFSNECNSCLLETHLKCHMLPTIINHDSHHHFLSLQLCKPSICKACASSVKRSGYGCYVCGLYYCVACVSRPGKVEHNHGGHEHVLKLVYSRDGMELEEDYWCDICYQDLDPQHWFYSCRDCPDYEAHADCIMPRY